VAKIETYGGLRTQEQGSSPVLNRVVAQSDTVTPILTGVNDLAAGVDQFQENKATVEARDLFNQFESQKNDLLFNPEQGYFTKQGKNAFDSEATAIKDYQRLVEDFKKKAPSSRARDKFNDAANRDFVSDELSIKKHAANGFKDYESATLKSRAEGAINNGSLYYNDDAQVAKNMAVGIQAVADNNEKSGITGEAGKSNVDAYKSTYVKELITSALDRDDIHRANQLYVSLGDAMLPDDMSTIDGAIKEQNLTASSDSIVGNIYNENRSLGDMLGDVAGIKGDSVEVKEIRKRATAKIKSLHSERKAIIAEDQKVLHEEFGSELLGGTRLDSIKGRRLEEFNSLDLSQKRTLMALDKSMAKSGDAAGTGADAGADGGLLEYLKISEMSKEEIAKLSAVDYAHIMDKTNLLKLDTLIKSARKEKSVQAGVVTDGIRTTAAITTEAIEGLVGEQTKDFNDNEKRLASFIAGEIEDKVAVASNENKGKLSKEQYRSIVSDYTTGFVKQEGKGLPALFNSGTVFDEEYALDDVPVDKLGQISAILKDNDIPRTATNIIGFYLENKDKLQ